MKSDSWLTLSALKGCSLSAPCLWLRVLCCPQPRSYKNSPAMHKHWPSRSHLTAAPEQSLKKIKSIWKQKNALQVHSSYAYTENARGPPSSDVILNVFLAFQYRRGATVFRAETEIRVLWERSLCVCVCDTKIVSQRRGFRKKNQIKKKSHKRNLNCVDIWYSRKKIQKKSRDAKKKGDLHIFT